MSSGFGVLLVVALALLLNAGSTKAVIYLTRVGENATLAAPTGYENAEFVVQCNGRWISSDTVKYQLTRGHLIIVNVTLEDAGVYEWMYNGYGYPRWYEADGLIVIDSINGSVLEQPLVYGSNKTLVCEYRMQDGYINYIMVVARVGHETLSPNDTNTLHSYTDSLVRIQAFFNLSHVTERSFRCVLKLRNNPEAQVESEEIMIGGFNRLALLQRAFSIAISVPDYQYLGLDVNDIPVLAGNRPDWLIPGHAPRFQATNQDDPSKNQTVVTFSIPEVSFDDAGIYRMYLFGHMTLDRVNVIVADEPKVIVPDQVVAGETVQLECRLRYHTRNMEDRDEPLVVVGGRLDNSSLSPLNHVMETGSNSSTVTQMYEIHICADHHMQMFSCHVQLEANVYEVIEAATELHVLYPPTWVEISPLPRGGEYIVNSMLMCDADANPPPDYLWINTKTGDTYIGPELYLNSSFLDLDESLWECHAINVIHNQRLNASSKILFRTVTVQSVVVSSHRLVREGGFVTVTAEVHMLDGDLLAVENDDRVLVASGVPFVGDSAPTDKFVLAIDSSSVHLLVRDAMLEDSGSYRWSIFGTSAVARANVIVAETPQCLVPETLVAGQEANLTCRFRFGIGDTPEVPAEQYPQEFSGVLAGQPLVPISSTLQKEPGAVVVTEMFQETVFYEWHLQTFTCRLSLTHDSDDHVHDSATLHVTGVTGPSDCLTRHSHYAGIRRLRRRRRGAL